MANSSENTADSSSSDKSRIRALTIAALGVVFGDIGTSPLYTLREILSTDGLGLNPSNLFGILSLIFWALIICVTAKYVLVMLRADNKGEGGIMALMALTLRHSPDRHRKVLLLTLGIFGAALFYGDSVITPAISVLSAVEGLHLATPAFDPYVLPIALGILVGLFAIQRHGTSAVGKYFGPVMGLWFATLAGLGCLHIAQNPMVLAALWPGYAIQFALEHGWIAFLALGAVVLALTGGEALYADMGHFGKAPIRKAWFYAVFPALTLNYFGQGALLLSTPSALENPFFRLAPDGFLYPLIGLATCATIIASQAVISGAFSLTRQAIHLGYWPRMLIRHTSENEEGQIYIPSVNLLLGIAVIAIVLLFKESSAMASAYGIAVTATMAIDTLLAYEVSRQLWRWPRWASFSLFGAFLLVDIAFFSANTFKIPTGGWFPLVLGLALFGIMLTWYQGRRTVIQRIQKGSMRLSAFLESVGLVGEARVQGTAVFIAGDFEWVPHALMHNLYHNKVLHQRIFLVRVITAEEPHIPSEERLSVDNLGQGFWGITVRYGFMDTTNLVLSLRGLEAFGLRFKMMETSFFVTRQNAIPRHLNIFQRIRMGLFATMLRNAPSPSVFFKLPPNRVIEVGSQVEL